jgi:hypothetical protein
MTDANVQRLFANEQPPGPSEDEHVTTNFVEVARAISKICATRMLLLIAVLTGAGVWAWTIYDPVQLRIVAAVAYSIVFVLPQTLLYWRRG